MMGYNLFGQTEVGGKLSGVFGSEAIAGGYIQKFALMSFFGFLFGYSSLDKTCGKGLSGIVDILYNVT